MSNVKSVYITGEVPFDWIGREGSDEALRFARHFLSPSFGLKLTYYGRERLRSNEHGGQTATFNFSVSGEEAVRSEWVQGLVDAIEAIDGACVDYIRVTDVENDLVLMDGPRR